MLASEGLARRDEGALAAPGPAGLHDVTDRAGAAGRGLDRSARRLLAAVVVTFVAVAVGWHITPVGLGIAGDSVTYIGVSNNIVEGKGITSPFVNEWDELSPRQAYNVRGRSPSVLWPPGYPVAIATGTHLGLTVQESARWLSILSFAIVAAGAGWLASRLANGSPAALLAAGLFVAFSPRVEELTTLVYSDVLAAALSTLAVIALIKLFEGKLAWLATFWALAVLTSLTRVAGATLLVVAIVLIALWYPAGLRRRLAIAAAMATGFLPLILWRAHVAMVLGGTPSNFSYHPRSETVTSTPGLFWEYLFPEQLDSFLRPVAIVAAIALTVLVAVRLGLRAKGPTRRGPLVEGTSLRVIVAVIIGYTVATIFAAFYFGALLTVDIRTYLSTVPLLVGLLVGLAAGLIQRPDRDRRWRTGAIPLAAVAVVVLAQGVTSWNFLITHPLQPSTHVIGTPDDLQLGAVLARYDLLFSNSPSRLYTGTGLMAITPPTYIKPSTLEANPDHDRQLADMASLLREHRGAYVYYIAPDFFGDRTFLPGAELVDELGLEQVGTSAGGEAIVYAPKPEPASRPSS